MRCQGTRRAGALRYGVRTSSAELAAHEVVAERRNAGSRGFQPTVATPIQARRRVATVERRGCARIFQASLRDASYVIGSRPRVKTRLKSAATLRASLREASAGWKPARVIVNHHHTRTWLSAVPGKFFDFLSFPGRYCAGRSVRKSRPATDSQIEGAAAWTGIMPKADNSADLFLRPSSTTW